MSIKVIDLNYTYGAGTAFEQHALKHVNFEINDGEFVGLIGHTGSGKSTLIQHLNGLIRPTGGDILYHGTSIYSDGYKMKELRSKVGLVFQYPEHQLFEADVFSDVCFGPKNLGCSKEETEKRARHALDLVGMDESFYEQSPFELSGGQKKRLSIASALSNQASLLIMDEPGAALDLEAKEEILTYIRNYLKNGGTVILTSHETQELSICTQLFVMKKGLLMPVTEKLSAAELVLLF